MWELIKMTRYVRACVTVTHIASIPTPTPDLQRWWTLASVGTPWLFRNIDNYVLKNYFTSSLLYLTWPANNLPNSNLQCVTASCLALFYYCPPPPLTPSLLQIIFPGNWIWSMIDRHVHMTATPSVILPCLTSRQVRALLHWITPPPPLALALLLSSLFLTLSFRVWLFLQLFFSPSFANQ